MLMLVDGIKWSRTRESRERWHASARALEKYTRLAMGKLDFSSFLRLSSPNVVIIISPISQCRLIFMEKHIFESESGKWNLPKGEKKRAARTKYMNLVRNAERRQKLIFTTFENGAFCVWMRSRNDDEAGGELNEMKFNFRLDFKTIRNSLIACLRGKRLNFDLSNDENYNEIV